MTNRFTTAVRNQITAFRALTAVDAVSPDSLGAILDSICVAVDALAETAATDSAVSAQAGKDAAHDAAIASLQSLTSVINPVNKAGNCPTLNQDGLIPRSRIQKLSSDQLPDHVVYSNHLLRQLVGELWSRLCAANNDTTRYPMFTVDDGPAWMQNGVYEDFRYTWNGTSVEAPFVLYGYAFNLGQAVNILFDRFIPSTGGVQMRGGANFPQPLKSTDSSLDFSYMCTNNWRPYVVALDIAGRNGLVAPKSIYRAFHGVSELIAVYGRISLKYVTDEIDIRNAFKGAPKLRVVFLQDIPDCISSVDMSGVNPAWVDNITFKSEAGTPIQDNCLVHLINNVGDRSAPLEIRLPADSYDRAVANQAVGQALASCPVDIVFAKGPVVS